MTTETRYIQAERIGPTTLRIVAQSHRNHEFTPSCGEDWEVPGTTPAIRVCSWAYPDGSLFAHSHELYVRGELDSMDDDPIEFPDSTTLERAIEAMQAYNDALGDGRPALVGTTQAESDDGWSRKPVTIDGKQYFHKSGIAEAGSLIRTHKPSGREAAYVVPGGSSAIGGLEVLLKPVEPDPPRFPTPDQFVEPEHITGDSLRFVAKYRSWKDEDADILRRQLESEERAVELLRRGLAVLPDNMTFKDADAFLRARDEGLPWPEGATGPHGLFGEGSARGYRAHAETCAQCCK